MRTRPGFVWFYYGAMRARKTLEAVLAAEREYTAREIADMKPEPILYLKPSSDTRDSDVRSFSGLSRPCVTLPAHLGATLEMLREQLTPGRVCVTDEVQFLPLLEHPDHVEAAVDAYLQLFLDAAANGCALFLAGLDADYLGQAFPLSRALLVNPCLRRTQLFPVCATCGSEHATLTQRLFHGKPAPRSMPSILPEGENTAVTYEPRCFHCHIIQDEATP